MWGTTERPEGYDAEFEVNLDINLVALMWGIPLEVIVHMMHDRPMTVHIEGSEILIAAWDCFACFGHPGYPQRQ